MAIERQIDWLDQIKPEWLLLPNGLLALFVLVAHTGWLILTRSGPASAEAANIAGPWPYLTIPLAALFVGLSIYGWFRPASRTTVLKWQTIALGSLGAFALFLAIDVIADGPPRGVSFVWNPLFFAFVVAYPVFLARRTLVPQSALSRPMLRYAHIIAAILALLLSGAVYWRLGAP